MEKRLGVVTLGVRDLGASRRFYEHGLGWPRDSGTEAIAFYQLGGLILALYEWGALAEDAGVPAAGEGFRGLTLGYCARSRDEVDAVLAKAKAAGAAIKVAPRDTFWGGYDGYFADPDGHLWEVLWNPALRIDAQGGHFLPP